MDHLGLRGHHNNDLFLVLLLLLLAFNIACSEVATLTTDTFSDKVPVKTPKADLISKDLVRRGFRGVGPTVIYSFMQTAGMTNDRLISCHRFEEYCAASNRTAQVGGSCMNGEMAEVTEIGDDIGEKRMDDDLDMIDVDLELVRLVDGCL